MQEVIYSNKGGLGIILEDFEEESDFVEFIELDLVDTLLKPGDYTDLFGMFSEPLRYVGVQKNVINNYKNEKKMVFYTGDGEASLFEKYKYYYCFFWITNKIILNIYSSGTARDFKWIDGKWK